MAVIDLRRRVKAQPDVVWKVISDMAGLALTAPHISKVEILEGDGVGLKRRLHDHQGRWWIEECTAFNEMRDYSMRIGESNVAFAFKRMDYTWGMREEGEHVTIRMRFDYLPRYGPFGRLFDRFKFRRRFEELSNQVLDGWVNAIQNRDWAQKVTVESLLEEKGRGVISVEPALSIGDLTTLLREKRIGCVLVLDPAGALVGLVSERDVVGGIAEQGPGILTSPVSEIMTRDVIVCAPTDNMMQIMSSMTERRIRHLPVVVDDVVLGIVSIGDVVKTRIEQLESESETLREFIAAGRFRDAYRRMGPSAGEFL